MFHDTGQPGAAIHLAQRTRERGDTAEGPAT